MDSSNPIFQTSGTIYHQNHNNSIGKLNPYDSNHKDHYNTLRGSNNLFAKNMSNLINTQGPRQKNFDGEKYLNMSEINGPPTRHWLGEGGPGLDVNNSKLKTCAQNAFNNGKFSKKKPKPRTLFSNSGSKGRTVNANPKFGTNFDEKIQVNAGKRRPSGIVQHTDVTSINGCLSQINENNRSQNMGDLMLSSHRRSVSPKHQGHPTSGRIDNADFYSSDNFEMQNEHGENDCCYKLEYCGQRCSER
jgi:hypothetical protein